MVFATFLRILGAALLAALACGGSDPLFAQAQNRIEGRIQISPPGPVPGDTEVRLKLVTGSQIARTSAAGNGRFTFDQLRPGKYIIAVEAEGFQTAEQQVEILSGFMHNVCNVVVLIHRAAQSGEPSRERSQTIPAPALAIPKEAQKKLARAEELAARGDYRAAIGHLEEAVGLAPSYFQAFNNMGVYYFQTREKDKALQAFERALAINPDALDPHSNLGILYLEQSRPDRALPHLERAAQLNPASSRLFYQLARARIFLRQFDRAEEPLRKALRLNPPVVHARYLLAHVLYELGRKADAVEELRLYLESNPKNKAELENRLKQWEREAGE